MQISCFRFVFAALLFLAVFTCPIVWGEQDKHYLELVSTIELDDNPLCIAVNELMNRVYVGLNHSIVVIDGATDTIVSTFPLDFKVEVLKVNPNTNHVFVSAFAIDETYVLDGSSGLTVHSFSDNLRYSNEIAINPATNLIYLADWTAILGEYDKVRVIDGNTFEDMGVINVPGSNKHPYMEKVYVEVDSAKNLVYIMWTGDNTLHVVDGNTYEVLNMKSVSFNRDISVNPVTNYVYFGSVILDGESLDEVFSDYNGLFMAIDPTLNLVYTSSYDSLYALDGNSHEVTYSLKFDDMINLQSYAAVNARTNKLYIADYYENTVSVVVCQKDETSPTITITSPADGSFTSTSNVEVNWVATDIGLGINYYEVELDDAWSHVGNVTKHTFQNIGEGRHTASVKAFDIAGNTRETTVAFVVDLMPPQLDITSPNIGSVIKEGSVTVTWTGSDNLSGIDHYEIKIDGEPEINAGKETTYTFTQLSDGKHEVRVTAVDQAGGYTFNFREFTINTSLFGLPGWFDEIAILGVIPIVLIIIYLSIKRKK